MARSMWNGAIAFGSVSIPIKVFAATDPRSLGMRELHVREGAPLAHRYFDADSGSEIPSEQVVRGAEVASGEWVVLSADELKAAEKPKRRAVEIEAFVPEAEVDPVYYDRAYNLAPQDAGQEGYAVLLEALSRTGRSGVGRVVLRSRERLVTVRAAGGTLRMHTMRFHDELVRGGTIRIQTQTRRTSRPEIEMARTLIDKLSGDFEPASLRDSYRERVLKMARAKARGERPKMRRRAAPKPTDDLLDALRASVARAA